MNIVFYMKDVHHVGFIFIYIYIAIAGYELYFHAIVFLSFFSVQFITLFLLIIILKVVSIIRLRQTIFFNKLRLLLFLILILFDKKKEEILFQFYFDNFTKLIIYHIMKEILH